MLSSSHFSGHKLRSAEHGGLFVLSSLNLGFVLSLMVPVGRNDLTRQFRVLRIISASNSISLELDPHLCSGLGEGGWYIESKGSYKETRPCASGEVSWPSLPA